MRLRPVDEQGSSLVSTVFGVLMFLVMLLFAVQVTTHLHATTVVTTAAFDAARLVSGSADLATGAVDNTCRPPTESELARADTHLADLLGGLWEAGGTSDWRATSADEVIVTVSVPTPARVVGGVGVIAGLDRIERTVSLTRECLR